MFEEDKILAKLGLEIEEDKLFFTDNLEGRLEINLLNIKAFSIHKAYTAPIEKLKFWIDKYFILRTKLGMPDSKSYYHDYREDYEFEIDMLSGKVYSNEYPKLIYSKQEKLLIN